MKVSPYLIPEPSDHRVDLFTGIETVEQLLLEMTGAKDGMDLLGCVAPYRTVVFETSAYVRLKANLQDEKERSGSWLSHQLFHLLRVIGVRRLEVALMAKYKAREEMRTEPRVALVMDLPPEEVAYAPPPTPSTSATGVDG